MLSSLLLIAIALTMFAMTKL